MKKLVSVLLVSALVGGCASEPGSGKSTSTVSGQLNQATYPSVVLRVVAQDESGTLVGDPLSADGRFSLTLKKGHRYRLGVALEGAQVPVVFPRANAGLGQWIDVQSGGAIANLGLVTYYASMPATGFKVLGGTEAADGECENGVDAVTGAACVDDDGEVSCEAGDDDDIECENGIDAATGLPCVDDDEAADDEDIECENGVDVATGAACVDVDEASADGAMAVAEHNAPEVLGGCAEEEADD